MIRLVSFNRRSIAVTEHDEVNSDCKGGGGAYPECQCAAIHMLEK